MRTLFWHLNFQKWSDPGAFCMFCTFWLGNVLCATTACTFSASHLPKVVRTGHFFTLLTWKCASRHKAYTFSTSQLPKVVRSWCALYILTSKCASRHNGVNFFISHLASWLRTPPLYRGYFSTLRSHKSFEKHSESTLLPFHTPASSFFPLFLRSDLLTSFLLLSDSSHLCFSICPYCRKFDFFLRS